MAASKMDIYMWLKNAQEHGATHMLVVCDTYDHEDYPISVMPDQDLASIAKAHHGTNMQRVMECYDLSMDLMEQANEFRAFHGWHP